VAKQNTNTINIRPGVSILSVLRHLNYRPWYALAEFVDNALQSYLARQADLHEAESDTFALTVAVELSLGEGGRIVVRDNAAGIATADYERAFRPAEVPPDRSGLSEFGMGMKSAACWLAARWLVRTKALGEATERTVSFDVEEIVQGRIEELAVRERAAPPRGHYTEVVLEGLHKPPQGRTVGKIKEHLASIYRVFLREGRLRLSFNGEPLTFEGPSILRAPHFRSPSAAPVQWRKEFSFDFGRGQRAWGFGALREKASTTGAGFALFRRNRLIQGSGDEAYRPEAIFGKPTSFRYQRLFGEVHLEGFEVSHTKDGFRWEEHEDAFLDLLGQHLNAQPLPLLSQAEEHRTGRARQALKADAEEAAERTAGVIARDVPAVMERQIAAGPDPSPPPRTLPPAGLMTAGREIDVELNRQPWRIVIELTTDPAVGDWVSVSDRPSVREGGLERRCVCVRLSLAHPFTDRFGGPDGSAIEALLRLAAAVGLAETAARDAGVALAGTFRRNINELLRGALSNP
jgi:hypothetical protein